MPSATERFIAAPRSRTEIIEDSLPRTVHSERTDLPQPQVTDMLAHLEATQGHPTASPAAIVGQPLTGALKVAEPMQPTGADTPAVVTAAADTAGVAADTAASAKCSV